MTISGRGVARVTGSILPERDYVTFGSMLSPIRLSVYLSSVTLVHPTQAVEPFANISSLLCTLAIIRPPCKILRRSPKGNSYIGGVKRKRCSKIQRFRTYRRLYLRKSYALYRMVTLALPMVTPNHPIFYILQCLSYFRNG